jgi:L-asparagine permease
MHYWGAFGPVPQWLIALVALIVVLGVNLASVTVFGELEFWFSLVKALALIAFLVVGTVFVAGGFPIRGVPAGAGVISADGGLLPHGLLPAIVLTQGVIVAYAGMELVGTAAGETADPEKVMPRAINSVALRIAVFYVGSVLLLSLLLPFTAYQAGTSPFVTFFAAIGVPAAGGLMNLVVLTAALSSVNAGLYSTGRIMRSMALNGSAPRFAALMSARGVPIGGIVLTVLIALLGVGLNAVVPQHAFEIVLNLAALAVLGIWAMIVLCQMRFVSWSKAGRVRRPSFRMPGSPWIGYLTLAFLAGVLVLMALDYPVGTFTIASLVVIVPALVAGWFAVRSRVQASAAERAGRPGEDW